MTVSFFDVAKYIIEKSGLRSPGIIQELCYIAQAYSFVWDDTPLFEEDFEAWANGPTYPKFYFHCMKDNPDLDETKMGGDAQKLNTRQKQIIDSVFREFNPLSYYKLNEYITAGEPYKQARKGVPPGCKCHKVITKESIANYYKKLCLF